MIFLIKIGKIRIPINVIKYNLIIIRMYQLTQNKIFSDWHSVSANNFYYINIQERNTFDV